MTKLQWTGVAIAIGVGIVAQIPDHDDAAMEGMQGHQLTMPAMDGVSVGNSVVTLAVTGMT